MSLWTAMDSTCSIVFGDERKAPICYGDRALTFGRIRKRPAQQTVASVGAFSAARPYPAGHPDALRFPRARRPRRRGGNHTCPGQASVKRIPAVFPSPAKAGRHVHSPGIPPPRGLILLSVSGLSPDRRRSSSCVRPSMSLRGPLPQSQAFSPAPARILFPQRGSGHPPPAPCSSAWKKPARAMRDRNFAETAVSA